MSLWTFLHVPADMITVGDFQSDWRKCNPIKTAIFKTRNGESGNGNGERGTGNGESLKWGIFKSGNL